MDEPTASIGMREIYTELVRLVGHMEGIDTRNKAADAIHVDHESRIRILERWRYALPASFFTAFASIVLTAIELFVRK